MAGYNEISLRPIKC